MYIKAILIISLAASTLSINIMINEKESNDDKVVVDFYF